MSAGLIAAAFYILASQYAATSVLGMTVLHAAAVWPDLRVYVC